MKTLKYILLLCFITCMMLSFANPSDSSLPPVPVGSARVGLKSTINGSKKDPQKYVPLNCFAVNNSSIQNSIPMTLDFTFTYNEFGCAGFASTPTLHTANGVIKLLPEAEMVHIDLEAEKLIATNINGTPTFARIIPHATSISTINGMTMTAAAQHYGLSPVEARRIIHIAQSTNNPNNLSVRVGLFTRSTIQAAYACNGGVDPDPIGGGDPYTESSRNGETRGSDGSTSSSLIADMDTWEVNVKIHIEVVAGMGVWNQTPYIGDWRINSVLQYFPENVAYDDYNRNVVSVPAFIGGINTQGSNYYNQSFYFDIYRQSSIIQHDCDLDPPHSNNNDDPIH
ncbi:MAG: hypothetical protein MRZ79_18240, partial [Bacteroidia bacterium]|nr:hypothetical protein [Bacteroidia bacterium]